jgi:mannan endo-1,4-beta-mannosidase
LARERSLPAWAAVLAAVVVALGGCSHERRVSQHVSTPAGPESPYLGVWEPGEGTSYQPVASFGAAVGRQPNVVLYYDNIPEQFPAQLAARIHAHGAIPLAQIDPDHATMAAVASGRYDAYLRSYARAVRAYGHQIIISFAAEMNGNWDQWGWHHTSPTTWIRAWRHVVDVFRAQHADNVTWLWTVNLSSPTTGPFQDWWPGARYVTWVGIDGYYLVPTQTFSNTFQPMITEIKELTGKPILLSETAVSPVAGATKIPDMFAGIARDHLLGLVWFDEAQHDGPSRQDWRLEDNPAAVALFRQAVTAYWKGGSAQTHSP